MPTPAEPNALRAGPRCADPRRTRALIAARAGAAFARAVGALCLAGLAHGQDSVSTSAGIVGDAVSVYATGANQEQVNDYVLHLVPIQSSWGRSFSVGPLAKASKAVAPTYFTNIVGAQAASSIFGAGPFLRASYATWTGAGPGIAQSANSAPGSIATGSASGYRFAAAFAELGPGADAAFGTSEDDQSLVTAVVDFSFARPNTLHVSRINALSVKGTAAASATGTLGLGAIDERGNLHAYADGFASTSGVKLTQRELVRVATTSRNAAIVNTISNAGFSDAAASSLLFAGDTPLAVPGMLPAGLAGGAGRPLMLELDLASNHRHESTPGSLVSTRTHLDASTDALRGPVGVITQTFGPLTLADGVGYCAALQRTDGNTRTRALHFWGVDPVGTPRGRVTATLPTTAAALIDPSDGFAPGDAFPPLSSWEFTNYGSQVPLRGPSGPVASCVLPDGRLIAAALISPAPGAKVSQSQDNAIAVAVVPSSGPATWTIAAHTGDSAGSAGGLSKVILGDYGADGIPNTLDAGEGDGVIDATPIGRLAKASEVFVNATTGPSISSPAIDRAGNLYFFACVKLNRAAGPEFTTALLRANRVTADNSYRLELLMKLGEIVPGADSTRNYQVQYLGISDADSVEWGGLASGNAVQQPLPGANIGAGGLPTDAPATLGALVFRARIVYDVGANGTFDDPSLVNGSLSNDQAYNVLMVLMPTIGPADFNRSGSVDVADLFGFLDAWFAQFTQSAAGLAADYGGDGAVGVDDLFLFLAEWFAAFGA
ncbi:MAG TPA: hypothetical protein PL072_06570 [Phycisphaerales bacterium]|nr:hypothetical protein [Phycisphaerales bacterium]